MDAKSRSASYAIKFKNDSIPAQIEEGLYLGSVGAAYNNTHLKSLNVTHILTVAHALPPSHPNDFTYKVVDVYDKPEVNLAQFFDDCFNFISEGKLMGGVLVHCFAGRSRSVTVVLAYLMKKYAMSLTEAMNLVKSKRSVASPNSGFMLQLQNYMKYLRGDHEGAFSRDTLSNLSHLKVQRCLDGLSSSELADFHDVSMLRMAMSGRMLSKDVRSLSEDVVRLRGEIVDLNNERVDAARERSRLESELDALKKSLADREGLVVENLQAENVRLVKELSGLREFSRLLESAKKDMEDDSEALRSMCRSFEEKDATFQATEASLWDEVESLKDKLRLALDDRAFVFTNVLPHVVKKLLSSDSFSVGLADLHKKAMLVGRSQALQEVVNMDLGLDPKALKDFEPDAAEAFEKVVDDFKQLKYPYLDMLAYHSRESSEFLLSLEPPSLPIERSSRAPSKSASF